MLRRIIRTDEKIHCLPEVFNNTYDGRNDFPEGVPYYFEYLESAVREDPAKSHPDAAYGLVENYFELIGRQMVADGRTALVDVKYSSLHHADAVWRSPGKRPEMVYLFKDRKYPILHLRRRNLVRLAFSLARAIESKQYVAGQHRDVSKVSFDLDIRLTLKSLEELKENDDLICRWLNMVGGKRLDLFYEDLFEEHPGSPFRRKPFEQIAELLGLDEVNFDLVPKTKKLAPQDLREEVRNFDELEAALAGSEFEKFLYMP